MNNEALYKALYLTCCRFYNELMRQPTLASIEDEDAKKVLTKLLDAAHGFEEDAEAD